MDPFLRPLWHPSILMDVSSLVVFSLVVLLSFSIALLFRFHLKHSFLIKQRSVDSGRLRIFLLHTRDLHGGLIGLNAC